MSSVQIEKSGDMLGYIYLTIDDTTQALDTSRGIYSLIKLSCSLVVL
jgi:hypothetical protein